MIAPRQWTMIVMSAASLWGAQVEGLGAAVQADSILVNGRIITVDAADSVAEAVAIRDGNILEVGTRQSVMRHAGKTTRIIDLRGRTATPGLIDSHLHFAGVGPLYSIDLSKVENIGQVLQAVRERVAKAKPGEWVSGQGWDEGKLVEHRYIYAADLDRIAPENPVWLVHTTGHYGVANSLALKLAHVTSDSKNPQAGTIDHDPQGHPSGVLKEDAAMRLVTNLIPPYSAAQLRSGYLTNMAALNKEGITGVKDPEIYPRNWSVYRELRDQNKLSIHLFVLWHGGTELAETREVVSRILKMPKPPSHLADDILISGGVKLYMDGSGGARTAWMSSDWNKNFTDIDEGNRGYPLTDPETYRQQVRIIHDAGIHIGTHAIGDRAIDWVVDTYSEALKSRPTNGLRHSIIHANLPSDHAISTMAALEDKYDAGYPEVQAGFMWWIGDTYAANFGQARSRHLIPLRTYLNRGIHWAGGSDYSVTPYPPRYGIWASVVRETLNGTYGKQPFGTEEAVDVHAALKSYTIWAARQLFLEDRTGSIKAGKDADIAIWDRDPYTVPAAQIKDMKCELTLFKGRIVYRDSGSPILIQ